MTETSAPDDRASRKKQARRTLFVLGLMVVAVAVAYLAGQVVERVLVSGYRPPSAPHRPTTRSAGDAGFDANAPMGAAGLSEFRGAPAGVKPPRGARRIYGVQRRGADEIERQVRYRASGSAGAVAAHYESALKALGFARLKDSPASSHRRRVMVFAKGGEWVTVSLLTGPADVKMVNVIVVAVEPIARQPTK